MRPARALAAVTAVLAAAACSRPGAPAGPAAVLMDHPVRLDGSGKLLPWSSSPAPYAEVARLAWTELETGFPVQDNGLPTYLAYARFDPAERWGVSWPHNPAGLYAMLADSAVLWYAFSGDRAAVELVRGALDHQLAHGTTPPDWDWASVPYASADPGAVDYGGADDAWCDLCGRGDGAGVLEPDKIGELGYAYAQFFELTGDRRYLGAAIACADALARHVREGDAGRSPWPFRVYARSNVAREDYSASVVGALMLFDELGRLGAGDGPSYARARAWTVAWMERVPLADDAWSGYFEDIEIQRDPAANVNQHSALRAARWLLAHPGDDPRWREHAAHLLDWTLQRFGGDTASERGTQWGATVLSEQVADMAKMGSHTARYGATLALWWEATGDRDALERAARSLAWATYACDAHGVVAVGPDHNEGWWFSDGYGDYIRHFLLAMGVVPDWAPPAEIHLVRSTSIVTRVQYAPTSVTWETFDADATETLRLPARPSSVSAGGVELPQVKGDLRAAGYTVEALPSGGVAARVRHVGAGPVGVTVAAMLPPTARATEVPGTRAGCAR